jgi:hypothetical protein
VECIYPLQQGWSASLPGWRSEWLRLFDIYESPRNLLDLQAARKVFKGKGELKITVSDLLNNKFSFYDNPSKKAAITIMKEIE